MAVRRRPSSMSTPPSIPGAQLLSGQVTPTQFNSKREIPTAHHSPATMARSNRTRSRSRQRDSRADVWRNWQPSSSLDGRVSSDTDESVANVGNGRYIDNSTALERQGHQSLTSLFVR